MSNIEVGEYIRTKKGIIGKVEHTLGSCKFRTTTGHISNSQDHYYIDNPKQRGNISELSITKHSFNIIDLIEVGDYVNGYRVTGIMCGYVYLDKINVETRKTKTLADYQIETILTHELYEQDSYKVVE